MLDSTPNCGQGASLAIDPGTGYARVSYYDSNNNKLLIARESSPGSWNYEAPFAGTSVSGNTSLCIDPSGYLCVSYIMDGKFFLTRESSPGIWNAPGSYFPGFTPSWGAITIEPGGAIQMAARDQATGQIYMAWESAGDMLIESGATFNGVDIKCVNGGDTRFAYTLAGGTLVYAVYDGALHKTYLDNFHCGNGVSLCLDNSANNYPMIAYYSSTDSAIRVAKQESPSSWTISHAGKRPVFKPGISIDYYPAGNYRGVAWGSSLDFGTDSQPLLPAAATATPNGAVYFGNRAAVSGNAGTALDSTSKKASIDFTARQTGSITDIRLYFEFKTGTAGYRVSIQNDDGSGKPDGFAIGGYNAYINTAGMSIGWNSLTLAPGPVLTQGVKYHIVIEWDGGSVVDSNNYAVITDGSRPNHMLIPYDQYYDGSLMTSFNSGSGYGITGYMPIFMYYNSTMSSWSGNPYASAMAWEIYGSNYINQSVNLTSASSIKEIGAYVRRTTGNMPADDLKWEIRTNSNTLVASGTLLTKTNSTTSFSWAKATMTPVPLSAGQYYVVLYSNLSTFPDSYTIVAADPANGVYPYMNATYDGITDFAMFSVNGGATWNSVNSSYGDFPVYLSSGSASGSTTGTAWYFKSASSDDPSGLASKMDMIIPTGAGTTNSTYPWACPGAIDFSLSVWDTPPVGTHIPAAGDWEFSLHVRDVSATGHYKLKLNVYKYAGGGSWPGTFLFTTTAPGTIPSSMQEVKWTEVNKPDYGFTATDRIYVEVRVVEDGTCPGGTTIDFTYEGALYAGYIKAPNAGSGGGPGTMWHLRDNYSVDPCCSIVREMKTTAPTGGSTYVQNTTINCCQAAGYTQFIREWDSEQVGTNIPGAGPWNFSIRSAESSGSNWGYKIRAEVYKYPAGGPIPATPLFTTDSPIIPSGLTTTLTWASASQPDYGFASTDRIYIKFYALVASASPPSATINIYYESITDDSWVQPPGTGSGGTGTELYLWTDFAPDPGSARMLHTGLPPGPVQNVNNWVGPWSTSELAAWTTGPLYNTNIDPGDWKFNFYGYETGGGVCVNYMVDVYDYSGTVPGAYLFSSSCTSLLGGAATLFSWTSAMGSITWTPGHSLYFSIKAYNACGSGRWVYLDYNGSPEYSKIGVPASLMFTAGGTPTITPTPAQTPIMLFGNKSVVDGNSVTALDDPSKKLSFRFTVSKNMTFDKLRIYVSSITMSPTFNVEIRDDDGTAAHAPGTTVYSSWSNVSFNSFMWNTIDMPNMTLNPGTIYHAVISPNNLGGGSAYFIFTNPGHGIWPTDQRYDQYAKAMLYTFGSWVGLSGMPVMVLINQDLVNDYGNPYEMPFNFAVHGSGTSPYTGDDQFISETFPGPTSVTKVVSLKAYVMKNGNPTAPLRYMIWNMTDAIDVKDGIMALPNEAAGTYAWVEKYIGEVTLNPGKNYRLHFYADGSGTDGANNYTVNAGQSSDGSAEFGYASYGGTAYEGSYTANGGSTWWNIAHGDISYEFLAEGPGCNFVFGKPDQGGSSAITLIDTSRYTLTQAADVSRLMLYIANDGGGGKHARVAIYDNDPLLDGNLGGPKTLICESTDQSVTAGWNDFVVPYRSLPAGDYWLAIQSETGVLIGYDNVIGSHDSAYRDVWTYGNFPAVFLPDHFDDWRWAIKAELCVSGGPTPTVTPTTGPPAISWHLRSYLSDDPNTVPALSQNPPTGSNMLLTYSAPNCPSTGTVYHFGGWDSPVLGSNVPGAGIWKFNMYGGDPTNSNAYHFRVDVFKYAGGGGEPGTLLMSSVSPDPIPGTTGPVVWQETWPDLGFAPTDRIFIFVSAQVVGSCPPSSMLGIVFDSPGYDSWMDAPVGQGATPTPTQTSTALPVPTEIVYSVGVDMTDHKTGSPLASVSGGILNFSTAQDNSKTGIGDEVIINSGAYILYLTRKINTSTWEAMNSNGGVAADFTNLPVTSIKRAFSNMAYAVTGASDSTHLNGSDLVAMNKRINIVCYNDGTDTVAFGINGYTTDQARNINIFAPTDTGTQCNARQAHTGTAGTGYTINTSGYTGMGTVDVWQPFTQFTNIAFTGWAGGGNAGIRIGADGVIIYKCLITNPTGSAPGGDAIRVISSGINVFVVNNFIYNIPRAAFYIPENMTGVHAVFESNTVVNAHNLNNDSTVPAVGFDSTAANNFGSNIDITDSYVHAINYSCFGTGGSGIFSGSGHNASADSTATGTGSLTNQPPPPQFVNSTQGSEDLHLKAGSTLIGQGYDMGAKYNEDIDGGTRLPAMGHRSG